MAGETLNPVHEITEALVIARRVLRWKGLGSVKLCLTYECHVRHEYHELCAAVEKALFESYRGSSLEIIIHDGRVVLELAGATVEIKIVEPPRDIGRPNDVDYSIEWRNPGETK